MHTSVPCAGALKAVSLLVLLCLPRAGAGGVAGYLPPLGGEMPLTSTFGEYRTRHFHGGLDFSTGGETGMDVFAVASGHVYRIRVSGAGYGKALYLRLDDGRTAVYAHLKDFAPRIQAVAESAQRACGRYSIDYNLESADLRVSAGELIAHSGDTGAGPAHLHFEIREDDRQINPLRLGLRCRDSRPPRIGSMVLMPIGEHSMVDGRREALSLGLRWDRDRSRYTTSRTPIIQGDVAVACRLYDVADGKPNRLAPYGVALRLDGETRYDLTFDSVSLETTQEVELVYNFDYAMRGGTNVLNLFCAPGRSIGLSADESPLRGVISVERGGESGAFRTGLGRHTIEVEAWDYFGNRRVGEIQIIADNRPVLKEITLDDASGVLRAMGCDPDGDALALVVDRSLDDGVTWSEVQRGESTGCFRGKIAVGVLDGLEILRVKAIDKWGAASVPIYLGPGLHIYAEAPPRVEVGIRDGYAEVTCELCDPTAHAPEMWLVDGDAELPIKSLRVERTSPRAFRASVGLTDSLGANAAVMAVAHLANRAEAVIEPLRVNCVRGGGGRHVELPGGALLVTSDATFIDDVFVMTAVRDSVLPIPSGGLVPVGARFRFDPPTQFFNATATLYLPSEGADVGSGRVGLYRKTGEKEWRWVGNASGEGGRYIGGDISRFSAYALMEDVEPPSISRLRPPDSARVRSSRPTFEVRVRDAGSGLDWDGVCFTIDGERLITAWEAEANHAWAEAPYDLDSGPHRLEFFAQDRAGNKAAVTAAIFIVR